MNMPFSVSSGFFYDLTPEAAVDEFAAAGYTHCEFGLEHGIPMLQSGADAETLGRRLRAYAQDKGLQFPQGHLDLNLDLCRDVDRFKTWLDLFHGLGIKACVLHANGAADLAYDAQLEQRSAALRQLTNHIRGTNMTICLENLFSHPMLNTADTLLELLEAAGGDHLGICLDIGHLHRVNCHGKSAQTSREFIEKCGKRLQALHVHDNMGVNDDHLFPFCPSGLDWRMFVNALLDNGYEGLFNMELPGESKAPLEVRRLRLHHAKQLHAFLFSGSFLNR